MKVFFLGLNKQLAHTYNAIYSPVISIQPYKKTCPFIKKAFLQLNSCTHIILTSKNSATLFIKRAIDISKFSKKTLNKKFSFLVIGKSTAEVLKKSNINCYTLAPFPTSEGMLRLLHSLLPSKHKIFYPHSAIARDIILHYLQKTFFSFVNCPFYTIYYKKKIFPNKKASFIFTSPSTVASFFKYNKNFSYQNTYMCTGPITQAALDIKLLYQKKAEIYK